MMKNMMRRKLPWLTLLVSAAMSAAGAANLETDFLNPPDSAEAWTYWWWLNGAASNQGITRDFEEMKRQGISGALLFDAGKADPPAPQGPEFMSTAWRDLFKHALTEADRCGIALGVNLCSGWNAGGPWVTTEHAVKKLVGASTDVTGPGPLSVTLPQPQTVAGFYQDIVVLACPVAAGQQGNVWPRAATVDVTPFTNAQGHLTWNAPAGTWRILRIGQTLHGSTTQWPGSGPKGWEIDPMSAAAMDAHFAETGAKLIADAGALAGPTLQYFHIDSWELDAAGFGQPTWTPQMRAKFQQLRGYDPLLFLPAVLGATVDDAETTARFMADYRRTVADLVAVNYYGRLRELTVAAGMRGTHPESGGPFFNHWIDGLQCVGGNDIPMGEFWMPAGERYWLPDTNPSVKQAASAAHIYGKPLCQAESYTEIGAGDWISFPSNMKHVGDEAFCHGLTRQMLCFWIHQPDLDAVPGTQWVNVGTHFDSNITWWDMGDAWLRYLARCQHLLRQGLFVADFAYFRGEDIPGFIEPRDQQQPLRPAGFDYDAVNAEVLLGRATSQNGRLVLPDGMSYRYLVLPHREPWTVSPAVLLKIKQMVEAGLTVIGPRPSAAVGLTNHPANDQEVANLADALWGTGPVVAGTRQVGAGRVISSMTPGAIVNADNLAPDIEFRLVSPEARLDWIHRREGENDIYFVSNPSALGLTSEVVFRVAGKQPELWDPVNGKIRDLTEWSEGNGRTVVPLELAPRQSCFVVFRETAAVASPPNADNFPALNPVTVLAGAWQVAFDPAWGGPASVVFDQLVDWTTRSEPGIRYYSGTATYRKTFDMPAGADGELQLDLGTVRDMARVRLNGQDLGVVWTAPWRVAIKDIVQPTGNLLEIDIVNRWPNRLIGDAALPAADRFTKTNVTTYTASSPLLPSGLLGPVLILTTSPDTFGPAATGFLPADASTVPLAPASLKITFNEPVMAGSGTVTIRNLTDSIQTVIDVTDSSRITFAGNTLTITPAGGLLPARSHAVRIAAGAIKDATGNPYGGIHDDETWNFTIAAPPAPGPIAIANSGFEDDFVADNGGRISPPSSWSFATHLAPPTVGSATGYVGDKQWLNTVPPGLAPGLIPGAHSGDQYYIGHVIGNNNGTFAILHQDTGLAWASLSAGDTLTLSAWATYRNDFPGSANTAMWLNYPDNGGAINSVGSGPGWFNVSSTGPAAGAWTKLSWTYTVTQADIDAAAANSWGAVNVAIGFMDTANGSQVAFDDVSLVWSSPDIPPGAMRIMCLGDSITTGYTDNPGWTNHPFKFGYRSGLHGLLTNAGYSFRFVGGSTEPWTGISGDPTHGGTYKPAFDLRDIGQDGHRGYGGTTASGLQGGIASWLASDNPDLILLKVGTNSQDAAALNTLVDTIFTTKPGVRLIVARIMPKYTYEAGIVSYNNYIRDTLVPNHQALGRKITMVDQYAPFLTNPADLTTIDQALFSNGINHPSNPGYDKMAQVWFAGIEALGIAPNNFSRWIAGYPAAGSQTGLEDDPDHDGIPNGVENFFGTSPGVASAGVNHVQQVGNTFTFTHPQNATPAADMAAAYLWSKDLTTFKPSGTTDFDDTTVAITPRPDTPQAGTTTVTATVTGTAAPKLFVKVRVTRN
jgi:alpha-L-rhamnosidase/Bacterial Ig-like domain